MASARIALATSAEIANLDEDESLLRDALIARGIDAQPAVWSDESIDWSQFNLVILRSVWDYTEHHARFLEWAARVSAVTRLLNSVDVITWNSDKRYLRDLAAAGIPVVPTFFVEPDAPAWEVPADCTDFVVKPAVSAGSKDTARYGADDSRDAADAHVNYLLADGRTVMIQPYLNAVDTAGETAVIFMGGEFSHSIRKGAMLPTRGEQPEHNNGYVAEEITSRTPSDAELALARRVLAAYPGGADQLLYARVDLIPDAQGNPMLIEFEVTEPSLFFGKDAGAADRMAGAIIARL